MRISITKISTVQGDTCYKVTDYEDGGTEVVAPSIAELLHRVLECVGFAADPEDCRALVAKSEA
jgi:hypothetical protein